MGRRERSAAQVTAQAYLDRIATDISADLSAGDRIGERIVELDIAKCRLLADGALKWAKHRERIQRELKTLGIDKKHMVQTSPWPIPQHHARLLASSA
jgi:hypothetical protein